MTLESAESPLDDQRNQLADKYAWHAEECSRRGFHILERIFWFAAGCVDAAVLHDARYATSAAAERMIYEDSIRAVAERAVMTWDGQKRFYNKGRVRWRQD